MSDPWPQLQSLPHDGLLWLLTWLGPLYLDTRTGSQRLIMGALRCVNDLAGRTPTQLFGRSPPRPDQLGAPKLVSFAVGELPMLTIGTFFRDGRALNVGSSTLKRRTFIADFSQQRVFRLNQIPAGQDGPVLSHESCLLAGAWTPMARGACVGLPQQDDPFAVCVPSTEVLRWCYGSSSRMLQAVLSMELPGVIQGVQKTMARVGRILDLQLPDGFVEQDAPTLGWLATDAAALGAARRVDRSVLVNTSHEEGKGQLSHPSMLFPYHGMLTFTVLGREIPYDPHPRFLVHRILGASFKLPFQVRVPVPVYDQHPPETEDELPQTRGRRRGRARGRKSKLNSKVEPQRQRGAAQLPALPSQFSALPVLHRQVSAGVHTPGPHASLPAPSGELSTGLGEDRSSSARKAILTLRKPQKPTPDPPVQNDAFDTLRLVFEQLRTAGAAVREIPLNNPGGQEARFTDWVREDGTRVACLVAAIKQGQRFWYVLEQERRAGEYGPLLLAQRPEGGVASTIDLNDLLDQALEPNTWPKRHGAWTLLHVRHGFRSVDGFVRGLEQRLGWMPPAAPEPGLRP